MPIFDVSNPIDQPPLEEEQTQFGEPPVSREPMGGGEPHVHLQPQAGKLRPQLAGVDQSEQYSAIKWDCLVDPDLTDVADVDQCWASSAKSDGSSTNLGRCSTPGAEGELDRSDTCSANILRTPCPFTPCPRVIAEGAGFVGCRCASS